MRAICKPIGLTRRPVEWAAADEVDVQVKHRLTGAGANVKHSTIAVLNAALPSDLGSGDMTPAEDLGFFSSCFFQSADVFFRHHQNVSGSFRIEVFEGISEVIFVNFSGRNFSGNNAAKEAIGHIYSPVDLLKHNA